MLTVLGLGPADARLLTREAWAALEAAPLVLLRTARHPAVAGLPKALRRRSFDREYARGENFEAVYQRIVEAVLAQARRGDVLYAVPGHPLVGEATTPALLARARSEGIPTRVIGGMSFVEPCLEQLAAAGVYVDPLDGLQVCDALDLAAQHHPALNPDKPALVAQIYARGVASEVKLTLMNQLAPEHAVWVVNGPDPAHPRRRRPAVSVALGVLDHQEAFDHLTSLFVPALPRLEGWGAASVEGLHDTLARLRAPDGCPWDQKQTPESMREAILEEACEVIDAIDAGDTGALVEELGDLLFNVLFQAQIATEAAQFRMGDVVAAVDAKLKRRHPHIFGDVTVSGVGEVLTNWEAIKRQEHAARGKARTSALDGIPAALPALAQSQKLQHRAERAGFKWETREQRLRKVREELREVIAARSKAHLAEELGDLLFTLVNYAEGHGIDAELALRAANRKFGRRFRGVEALAEARGIVMKTASLRTLTGLWREAKAGQKAGRA